MRWKSQHGRGDVTAVEVTRRQTALEFLDVVVLLEEYLAALRAPVVDAAGAYRYRMAVIYHQPIGYNVGFPRIAETAFVINIITSAKGLCNARYLSVCLYVC